MENDLKLKPLTSEEMADLEKAPKFADDVSIERKGIYDFPFGDKRFLVLDNGVLTESMVESIDYYITTSSNENFVSVYNLILATNMGKIKVSVKSTWEEVPFHAWASVKEFVNKYERTSFLKKGFDELYESALKNLANTYAFELDGDIAPCRYGINYEENSIEEVTSIFNHIRWEPKRGYFFPNITTSDFVDEYFLTKDEAKNWLAHELSTSLVRFERLTIEEVRNDLVKDLEEYYTKDDIKFIDERLAEIAKMGNLTIDQLCDYVWANSSEMLSCIFDYKELNPKEFEVD